MTTPDVDPFAEDPITRDQYGRPRIIPIKRGKPDLKGKLVGYTRVSTYADAIADAGGLATWRLWHLALGLGRNPDLAALAGTYGPTVDDLTRRDKAELSELIERAHDRSGGNVKADYGTAVHSYTEPGAQDVPDPFGDSTAQSELLASLAADAAAFTATLDAYGLEIADTETFIVNDEVQCAGTYDHLVKLTRDLSFTMPDGKTVVTVQAGAVLVLDKKTGKLHLDSQSIQLATYANGKHYEPETGARSDHGASFDYAILAHIPKGEARCDLHLIDLRIGWAAAKLAGKVREHRTRKDIGVPFPAVEPSEPASDALAADEAVSAVVPAAQLAEIVPAAEGLAQHDTTAAIAEATERYETALANAHAAAREARNAAPTDAELRAQTAPAEPVDEMGEALATVTEIFGNVEPVASIVDKLRAGASREALAEVWRAHKHEWTDEHTAALRARAAELESEAA